MKPIFLLFIISTLFSSQLLAGGNDDTNSAPSKLEYTYQANGPEKPFTFYPIPAEDFLNVKFNLSAASDIAIIIRNSIGVEVANINYSPNEKSGVLLIDTSKFATGIYFLEVKSFQVKEFKKIIKI